MNDQYGVRINVPSFEQKRDCVYVQGPASNCEYAKEALLKLVKDLKTEPEVGLSHLEAVHFPKDRLVPDEIKELKAEVNVDDREVGSRRETVQVSREYEIPDQKAKEALPKTKTELRSHRESIRVSPKYHANIIAQRGVTISKKYDVEIHFPQTESINRGEIVILGYKHQVRPAKEEILDIVKEVEEDITVEAEIDYRLHTRLAGRKRRLINSFMKEHQVVVQFPCVYSPYVKVTLIGSEPNEELPIRLPSNQRSNKVTITGKEREVEAAKRALVALADDLMLDVFGISL